MAIRRHSEVGVRTRPWQSNLRSAWHLVAVRRRRRRDMERRALRSPWSSYLVWARLSLLAAILALMVVGAIYSHHGLVTPSQGFARGFQYITHDHFTPGIWLELIVLLTALVNIRWLSLRFLAFRANSPIEVRPLDNATRARRLNTHGYDVIFRDYLALSRLYQIPTIPGDQEPDRLIEVLSTPASKGWLGIFSAALTYAFPRRAFVVTASLLKGDQDRQCGVSVQVRRFPRLPIHLETQWSTTFERALQRAAYAVSAHITQQTKACRRIPWSEWARRRRHLPASLFRDYQRAKQMVGERRWDEALALYHSALRQDADNIAMRYDIGQLHERLGLYPDALLTYLGLVDEIFPIIIAGGHPASPKLMTKSRSAASAKTRRQTNRRPNPTWWPRPRTSNRDPFVIRYRYVVVLGQGDLLAKELISAQRLKLPQKIDENPDQPGVTPEDSELAQRPWRATELEEIGRLLSNRLDALYSSYCGKSLARLLEEPGIQSDETRIGKISRYLLTCAEYEASTLIRDVERVERRPWRFRSRRDSFLTPTAARQAGLMISYRRQYLDWLEHHVPHGSWPVSPKATKEDLKNTGYSDDSMNWLEHYNAACYYALALVDDKGELPEHNEYAYESVTALDRASQHGDQVEFVMSKKYWLQAGDPDLVGLRYYQSFRAFEARVYGHPLPATHELAKYELYRFLRAVVRRAARHLEDAWRKRGSRNPRKVSHAEFEEWWRQELRAWEVAIRIGRFHIQWQTRHAALESIREWVESFGPEAAPIPYPNITRRDYLPDIGDYEAVQKMLDDTKEILTFLGTECGNLATAKKVTSRNVYENTWRWSDYAAACSRSEKQLPRDRLADLCRARAAVWASLRQWAQAPGMGRWKTMEDTIERLDRLASRDSAGNIVDVQASAAGFPAVDP